MGIFNFNFNLKNKKECKGNTPSLTQGCVFNKFARNEPCPAIRPKTRNVVETFNNKVSEIEKSMETKEGNISEVKDKYINDRDDYINRLIKINTYIANHQGYKGKIVSLKNDCGKKLPPWPPVKNIEYNLLEEVGVIAAEGGAASGGKLWCKNIKDGYHIKVDYDNQSAPPEGSCFTDASNKSYIIDHPSPGDHVNYSDSLKIRESDGDAAKWYKNQYEKKVKNLVNKRQIKVKESIRDNYTIDEDGKGTGCFIFEEGGQTYIKDGLEKSINDEITSITQKTDFEELCNEQNTRKWDDLWRNISKPDGLEDDDYINSEKNRFINTLNDMCPINDEEGAGVGGGGGDGGGGTNQADSFVGGRRIIEGYNGKDNNNNNNSNNNDSNKCGVFETSGVDVFKNYKYYKGIKYCSNYSIINKYGYAQALVPKEGVWDDTNIKDLLEFKNEAAAAVAESDDFKIELNIDTVNIDNNYENLTTTKLLTGEDEFDLGADITITSDVESTIKIFKSAGKKVSNDEGVVTGWVDYLGFYHETTSSGDEKLCENIDNVNLTDTQINAMEKRRNIDDCDFFTALDPELKKAKEDMETAQGKLLHELNLIASDTSKEFETAGEYVGQIEGKDNDIDNEIQSISDDNKKVIQLLEIRDTLKGQGESAGFQMDSNKMQVGVWLCIAIGLLLFTLFGINSDKILSGKNLVMLIICVLIFYVLARRLYLTRRF